MKEKIEKLLAQAGKTAFASEQDLRETAARFGYSQDEIQELLDNMKIRPLDLEAMDGVVGGVKIINGFYHSARKEPEIDIQIRR